MFCSGCGTQIQSGLNYCSRCGRRVAEEEKRGRQWTNPLVIAGQTAGVGFVAYIFILFILTRNGAAPNILVPLTFFYFAALFGICFMFLHYGRSSSAGSDAASSSLAEQSPEPAYLRPVTTSQLEEAREFGIGSVTDATTRTLNEVSIKERGR